MADFDNIETVPNRNNVNDGNGVENAEQTENESGGGLQNVIKAMSCLPCFPKYEPKPDTPNIDSLRSILGKFKQTDPNEIQTDLVERNKSDELAEWTQKVLVFLPNVGEAPESAEEKNSISQHFQTIKRFYTRAQGAGFQSGELDTFFNSLQIYEVGFNLELFK